MFSDTGTDFGRPSLLTFLSELQSRLNLFYQRLAKTENGASSLKVEVSLDNPRQNRKKLSQKNGYELISFFISTKFSLLLLLYTVPQTQQILLIACKIHPLIPNSKYFFF